MEKQREFRNQFEQDVYEGLISKPKFLSSKYFYDKKGDALFQKIMELPEYYPTQLEFDILEENKVEIAKDFSGANGFDLIELGAGDGKKTKILLKYFLKEKFNFKYFPVDISENVLLQLSESLKKELPALEVEIFPGNYAKVLKQLSNYKKRKKVILFLGSNIGNFKKSEAVSFLSSIAGAMENEDLLFIGFDQKKDPHIILDAYNDNAGVTEAFNKNLLKRINREMDADFDPENFIHWPNYNPETGTVKSFLVSKKDQVVNIKSLDLQVHFKAWESIHTEISQKFDEDSVEELAASAGLQILDYFADTKSWYRNYIFKKKEL